jgi:hypothetical protein
MSGKIKEDLVDAIDKTAFKLLRKIGGDDTITPQDSAILTEQVKAFGEIVKWAQARPLLVPKDEGKSDAKFARIKDDFHASGRTPRSRRSPDPPAAEVGPAADAGNSDADTDTGIGEDD